MKELNESLNILAVFVIALSIVFVVLHQPDLAKDLIIGAIGFMGGAHTRNTGGPSGSAA